jgi:stage II sporulation protein D
VRITATTWSGAISTGRLATPITIAPRGRGFVVAPPSGQALLFDAPAATIEPEGTAWLRLGATVYPNTLVLLAEAPAPGTSAGSAYDVVNNLPVERYIPGVLAKELFESWQPETFRALAVAARTYAIAECAQSRNQPWDVEATQASQAYAGATSNTKALSAVAATAGQVLTWEGRVFPAYYSSCCGGTGQDAARAIAGAPDIPPLRGQVHGAWCAASPQFRWGPITRSKADLAARLSAWGAAHGHSIARIRGLRDIQITARNTVGRPTQFTIVDSAGQAWRLGPETFRFACNYAGSGTAGLPASATLKSSYCEVRVAGEYVYFTAGRGFGHGAGLCQYGAEGLALKGYNYASILGFYYPGARIEKAY